MLRERTFWLLIGLLTLSSLACNAFAGQVGEPIAPPPTPVTTTPGGDGGSDDVVNITPSLTPEFGSTNTPNATSTPDSPTATVLVDLNVRSGPSVQYDRVSFLLEGENASIIGSDATQEWWKIDCPARTPIAGVQCWISAGSSFSTAVNTSSVPVAEIPPTPSPVPPDPQPGQAIIAYVDNGRLLTTSFDPNADEPAVAEPLPLLPDDSNVRRVYLSPDGRRIAYTRTSEDGNELHVVNTDGRDHRLLVDPSELPIGADEEDELLVVDEVQWLPNAGQLAFSTAGYDIEFGPLFEREDLWTVTLNGEVEQQLPPGQGGGLFLFLSNGDIVLSKQNAIEKIDAAGNNRQQLITFNFINTASEYIYYPLLQTTRSGDTVYTAIPSANPFANDAFTLLWRISGDEAEQIGRLPHSILFSPVQWTANGSRLGYAARDTDAPPTLVLANGNGQDAATYITGEQIQFWGWSGDAQHFLYATTSAIGVGQSNSEPVEIPIPSGGTVSEVNWLTNNRYLVTTRFGAGWRLDSGHVNGSTSELLVVPGSDTIEYDVWLP